MENRWIRLTQRFSKVTPRGSARKWTAANLALCAIAIFDVPAAAQRSGRVYGGAMAGVHHEASEWASGNAGTRGIVAGVWLTRSLAVEVEIARPGETFTTQYEGNSVSFAAPGASRAEIERLAVFSRVTHQRHIKAITTVGVVYGMPVHPRWTPRVFAGVTNRVAEERDVFTPLRYPDGVDPRRLAAVQPTDHRFTRNIGALTAGAGVMFAVTGPMSIGPECRGDYGSIGDEINNGARISMRAIWSF
jgi:hypothetical protein